MQILGSISQASFCRPQDVYPCELQMVHFHLIPDPESYQFRRGTDKLLPPGIRKAGPVLTRN